jgi:dolichol kinase
MPSDFTVKAIQALVREFSATIGKQIGRYWAKNALRNQKSLIGVSSLQ